METLTGLFMARVDAFLERTGVGPTTLGRQAVGDPNLIRQLRHGRSPTLATVDQLLAFMEGFDEAGVDPVSSRSDRLRDSSPRERRGRPMTKPIEDGDGPDPGSGFPPFDAAFPLFQYGGIRY